VRSRREKYKPCFAVAWLSELVIVSLAHPSTQMIEGAGLRGRMQIQPRRRRVDIPTVAFRLAQQLRITYLSTSCDSHGGQYSGTIPDAPRYRSFLCGCELSGPTTFVVPSGVASSTSGCQIRSPEMPCKCACRSPTRSCSGGHDFGCRHATDRTFVGGVVALCPLQLRLSERVFSRKYIRSEWLACHQRG